MHEKNCACIHWNIWMVFSTLRSRHIFLTSVNDIARTFFLSIANQLLPSLSVNLFINRECHLNQMMGMMEMSCEPNDGNYANIM